MIKSNFMESTKTLPLSTDRNTLPTEPGYYWWRLEGGDSYDWEIVEVDERFGETLIWIEDIPFSFESFARHHLSSEWVRIERPE